MSSKIALLIDAENISYKDLPLFIRKVMLQGQIVVRAVYGDWESPALQKWRELAEKHKFHLGHQKSHPNTKNSSDMKLIMDAMEILFRSKLEIDIFCLVTNDADYVPLCDKIHEAEKAVIGVGYSHAAETFIRACDSFIFITPKKLSRQPSIQAAFETHPQPPIELEGFEDPSVKPVASVAPQPPKPPVKPVASVAPTPPKPPVKPVASVAPKPPKPPVKPVASVAPTTPAKPATPAQKQPDVRKILSSAFKTVTMGDDGWITLSALGSELRKLHPNFKPNTYGHANLGKLLKSMPDFVELKVKDSTKSTRLKK